MPDARADAVYQELILDHFRRPRNRGALEEIAAAGATATVRNPLCGDALTMAVALDAGRVRAVRFAGEGCSIALATASMLTELAPGKDADALAALGARFAAMLAAPPDATADPALGALRALQGVARVPARHQCALLPWRALEQALATVARG
jgi:nitrogen fixation NifU-like protein